MKKRRTFNESTSGRAFIISIVGGLTLLALAVTVFAVASQARSVSNEAEQSVQGTENLRNAEIARVELSIAFRLSKFSAVDQDEVLAASIRLADERLDDVEQNFDEQTPADVSAAFAEYREAADRQAELILGEGTDVETAEAAELATGVAFANLSSVLVAERDDAFERLNDDNDLMNVISTIATFVVAFVVPSAALYIFEALRRTPRRARQLEHDYERNTATSLAMAAAVGKEATHLRKIIDSLPEIQRDNDLQRSVLRFEHVAALNGSVRTLHNVDVDISALAMDVTRTIGYPVTIDTDNAEDAVVIGDYEQISLVMVELLHNAVTHGSVPVGIEISTMDQVVTILVSDRGPGLPEAIEDAIIHDNDYATRGNLLSGTYGFGLLAAREATESLGGVLRYHRYEGQTSMIVELPRSHFANQIQATDRSLPAALAIRKAA